MHILFGRPAFSQYPESSPSKVSFFKKFASVRQVRPTSMQDPYSIPGKVHRLCLHLLPSFVSPKLPQDKRSFQADLDLPGIQKKGISEVVKNVLSKEGYWSPALKQYNTLVHQIHESGRYIDTEKQIKKTDQIKAKLTNQIINLKTNQTMLLPCTMQDYAKVYYILQRTEEGYTLKIIGCDETMKQFSRVPTRKIAGKEKILSQIAFKNIPAEHFTDKLLPSLFIDPLTGKLESIAQIKQQLDEIPAEYREDLSEREDLWVTVSNQPQKALHLALSELKNVDKSITDTKGLRKQLDFKMRVFTLFSLFKQTKFLLEKDPRYSIHITRLVREVAQEASLLHAKGYLELSDLSDIQKELQVITDCLENAKKNSRNRKVDKCKIPPLKQQLVPITIQPPVTLESIQVKAPPKSEEVRPPAEPKSLPVTVTHLFTDAEREAMKGTDTKLVMDILSKKMENLKVSEQEGSKTDCMALSMEIIQHLNLQDIGENSWHYKLSAKEKFTVQRYLLDIGKIMLNTRKEGVSLPNQAIALCQLVKFSKWLCSCQTADLYILKRINLLKMGTITIGEGNWTSIEETFSHLALSTNRGHKPIQKSCYLVDEENAALRNFLRNHLEDGSPSEPCDHGEESKELYCELTKLFLNFFGASTERFFKFTNTKKLLTDAFTPQAMQKWSKKIENPLLLSALIHMELKPFAKHVGRDLIDSGKARSYQSTQGPAGETIQMKIGGISDAKLQRMQEEFSRPESLKFPEAAHDNPQLVFEQQMAEILESSQHLDMEGLKKSSLTLKKEEMTDLLLTLRSQDPQMEVLGFIKTHPHLLKHADIRNFLEIVLFDYRGSNFYSRNEPYRQVFYSTLHKEIDKYRELAKTDSLYYDQLLFLLSISRKACAINQELPEAKSLAATLEDSHPALTIVKDPKLAQYAYPALHDYLLLKIKGNDLTEITRLYFRLQKLPKEAQAVDPNESDLLDRRYHVMAHSFKDVKMEEMSPLLDSLCKDQNLTLDFSPWTGTFPIFKNDQYEVNCLNGTIMDRSSGDSIAVLPHEIASQPAYSAAFADIDKDSLLIRKNVKDNVTVYLVSDKSGERGRIEVEKGPARFYKTFSSRGETKQLQVMPILKESTSDIDKIVHSKNKDFKWKALFREFTKTYQKHPIMALAGNALFFDHKDPHTGLVLEPSGALRFKVQLKPLKVIDCRGQNESVPYDIQTLDSVEDQTLKRLSRFENGENIVLFSQKGKLKQVELVRYGLKFHSKDNKLYLSDPKYEGYFVDLDRMYGNVPNALLLRHADPAKLPKVIVPDSPTEASQGIKQQKHVLLRNGWLALKSWLTGKLPDLEEFIPSGFKGLTNQLKVEKKGPLPPHIFHINPYTEELVPVEDKSRIEDLLALVTQSRSANQKLSGLRQLKITQKELTKEHLSKLYRFLETTKNEDGDLASIKLQLILELKQLMGKRKQYQTVSFDLDQFIQKHFALYLKQGRKLDQRLLLAQPQLEKLAKIIKKTDPEFYEQDVRILFVQPGTPAPPFTADKGVIDFSQLPSVPHEERIKENKLSGVYGTEMIPEETLETTLAAAPSLEKGAITIEKSGSPILFSDTELYKYFTSTSVELPQVTLPEPKNVSSCETMAVEQLKLDMTAYRNQSAGQKQYTLTEKDHLKKQLSQVRAKTKKEAQEVKKTIDHLLAGGKDLTIALAIQGGMQRVASFREISIAFMQNNLSSLKNDLPPNLNMEEFTLLLTQYYEKESQNLLLRNSEKILNELANPSLNETERSIKTNLLYQTLATKRFYSPEKHPNLLVYECFSQQIFRQLQLKNQIELVSDMLNRPSGNFQAVTGSGKTTVLSVLRGLLQAKGTNLVTFRLLPTLLEQSKGLFKKHLGDAFDKKIYTLEFTLKTPLCISEKRKEGMVQLSVFKKIYRELMETTVNCGCLLTDYKSIPLLQEKFIKLNREFLARQTQGLPIPDIEKEHWTYLRKILVLLKAREETCMDEFDVPNRSCNQLQIPLGQPVKVPPFLYEASLDLYEQLKADPRLKLSSDQQREVSNETKELVIQDLAKKLAGDNKDLLDYFLGKKNVDLSGYPVEKQDLYALYKDQLTIFLPLTLKKASGLDYMRNSEGTRTIPCHEGEPHENAKPGHPLEEINQTIQDYIANGVSFSEIKQWVNDLQDELTNAKIKGTDPDNIQKQFQEIFPGETLPKERMDEEHLEKLRLKLNGNWPDVKNFLMGKMKAISVSGEVISMNPHNSASMSKNVCGLSATLGCVDELPSPLQGTEENRETTPPNAMMGEMLYRLVERTGTKQPLEYDPEKPFDVLEGGTFHALIDGGGIYRSHSPKEVAEKFKSSQSGLDHVGYHQTQVTHVGAIESPLSKKGFYFPKAKCRGLDVELDPQAEGLLTIDRLKTVEDLVQNDGRMRVKGQKIRLARSVENRELAATGDVLVHCARNSGINDSTGLFRSKMQQIPHLVRQQAYEQLIQTEDLTEALKLFGRCQDVFIQKPANDYQTPGSYYNQNKSVRKLDSTPAQVLQQKKQHWLDVAASLHLSVPKLEALQWSEKTVKKMPEFVSGIDDAALGLEVEEEFEVEQEAEVEVNVEIEREVEAELESRTLGEVPLYPPWVAKDLKKYSASEWLHPSFDPRITFTENFLPVERKDPLFKREPFDRSMPKVRVIHALVPKNEKDPMQFVFGDAIEDVCYDYGFGLKHLNYDQENYHLCSYDIRMRKFVHFAYRPSGPLELIWDFKKVLKNAVAKDIYKVAAEARFMNGESDGYSPKEWEGLMQFFKEWEELPELQKKATGQPDMQTFFEKVVLRNQSPQKLESYKHSPLKQFFDKQAKSSAV